MALKWYIVHVYSGFENKVKAALEERIKTEADRVSRHLMRLRLQAQVEANRVQIDVLARERQLLRRILATQLF